MIQSPNHDITDIAFLVKQFTIERISSWRSADMPATIKDITDSYRRLNTKVAFTVFLIYDVAFAMVMPV